MMWARAAVLCALVAVCAAISGTNIQGQNVEAKIIVTGKKWDRALRPAIPENYSQDTFERDVKDWLNARVYNTDCQNQQNGYFDILVRSSNCVPGDGVDLYNFAEQTVKGTWSIQLRVRVLKSTIPGVADPTLCMSVNDVNRMRSWGYSTYGWTDVRFTCDIDRIANNVPCSCGDPYMLPPGSSSSGWRMRALIAIGAGGAAVVLLLISAALWYRERSKRQLLEETTGQVVQGLRPAQLGPRKVLKL